MQTAFNELNGEVSPRGQTGAVMAVAVERAASFTVSPPTKLFERPYYASVGAILGRTYDVSPDDRRSLMVKEGGDQAASSHLVVVQHWTEELKRLVPID